MGEEDETTYIEREREKRESVYIERRIDTYRETTERRVEK